MNRERAIKKLSNRISKFEEGLNRLGGLTTGERIQLVKMCSPKDLPKLTESFKKRGYLEDGVIAEIAHWAHIEDMPKIVKMFPENQSWTQDLGILRSVASKLGGVRRIGVLAPFISVDHQDSWLCIIESQYWGDAEVEELKEIIRGNDRLEENEKLMVALIKQSTDPYATLIGMQGEAILERESVGYAFKEDLDRGDMPELVHILSNNPILFRQEVIEEIVEKADSERMFELVEALATYPAMQSRDLIKKLIEKSEEADEIDLANSFLKSSYFRTIHLEDPEIFEEIESLFLGYNCGDFVDRKQDAYRNLSNPDKIYLLSICDRILRQYFENVPTDLYEDYCLKSQLAIIDHLFTPQQGRDDYRAFEVENVSEEGFTIVEGKDVYKFNVEKRYEVTIQDSPSPDENPGNIELE